MTAPQEDSPCSPAADLGPMWDVLDALPRTTASATLAATTVELAAVAGVRGSRGPSGVRRHIVRWLGPAATVAAALFTGIVAGRFTAPDPDLRILEHLPLVQHFDLLREAGSTKFLEEMLLGLEVTHKEFAADVQPYVDYVKRETHPAKYPRSP